MSDVERARAADDQDPLGRLLLQYPPRVGWLDEPGATVLAGVLFVVLEAAAWWLDQSVAGVAMDLATGLMTMAGLVISVAVMALPMVPGLYAIFQPRHHAEVREHLKKVLATYYFNIRVLFVNIVCTMVLAVAVELPEPVGAYDVAPFIAPAVPAFVVLGLWRCWRLVKEGCGLVLVAVDRGAASAEE